MSKTTNTTSNAIFHQGDWLLTRSYGQGATLGKLARDWYGEKAIAFSEAYHVRKFDVKDTAQGNMGTLTWQEPTEVEIYGGAPAVLNEDAMVYLLQDSQAESILKFAEKCAPGFSKRNSK